MAWFPSRFINSDSSLVELVLRVGFRASDRNINCLPGRNILGRKRLPGKIIKFYLGTVTAVGNGGGNGGGDGGGEGGGGWGGVGWGGGGWADGV